MKRLVLVMVLAGMISTAKANLVVNGDFSQGWTGWTAENFSMVNYSALANNTMAIRPTFTWSPNTWNDVLVIQKSASAPAYGGVYQTIDVTNLNTFDFSFKFGYTNIGSFGSITMYYYDTPTHNTGKYFQQKFDWTTAPDPTPTDGAYTNSSKGMIQFAPLTFTRGTAPSGNAGLIIPTEAKYVKLYVRANNAAYQYFVDEVMITPEPATMCLLGLGGLLFARRK